QGERVGWLRLRKSLGAPLHELQLDGTAEAVQRLGVDGVVGRLALHDGLAVGWIDRQAEVAGARARGRRLVSLDYYRGTRRTLSNRITGQQFRWIHRRLAADAILQDQHRITTDVVVPGRILIEDSGGWLQIYHVEPGLLDEIWIRFTIFVDGMG